MSAPSLPLELERAVQRALDEATGSVVTVQDAHGKLVYANDAATRLMGLAVSDVHGTPLAEVAGRFEVHYADGRPYPPSHRGGGAAFAGSSVEETVRFRAVDSLEDRWGQLRSVPVRDAAGTVTHAISILREVTEQTRDDHYRRFLLRVDAELSASLDYGRTLATVARLAVPTIADWCAIDLVDDAGPKPTRVAVAHTDPRKVALVDDLERRYPSQPNDTNGLYQVLRSGKAELVPEIPRQLLVAAAVDDEHLRLIDELQLRSYIIAPLKARGTVLGALSLVMAESGRHFTARDLEFVQTIADRAALAIENARLLRDAERDRSSAEESFRLMVGSVKDYAIFMLDPNGRVVTWNAGAEVIKGYRADEIIGQHFSRFYTDDAVRSGHCEHELATSLREGRFEEEGWRVRKDGSRFWANVTITPVRDAGGTLRGFAKVTRDLSERKRTEDELETYRMMVSGVRDYAIFMLDPTGHVATWNAGAEIIKGYRPDEIIGAHFSRFYTDDAARAGHCEHELEVAAREGRFEEEGWRVRKDGSRFWASVIITAIRNPDGSLRGFAKVTRDLSERKRAEDALRAEINRRMDAEQTSRLAQLFMGVLGHDLRNPLSAIMTGASYLKRISTGEKQSRTIERISASGDRMARMIEQLLDVTRFGIGGGIVLDIKRVDFADICRNVVEELATAHAHRKVRCDFIDGTVGDWDPIRLEQAISNLVGNAVQHGAPAAPVTLRVEGRPSELVLTLHNEGAIDAGLLPRIFAPFKRQRPDAPASGASSGLGLGLYISQQIIQAHRGAIEVSSSEAAGTTFVVTLPRHGAQATPANRGVSGATS